MLKIVKAGHCVRSVDLTLGAFAQNRGWVGFFVLRMNGDQGKTTLKK